MRPRHFLACMGLVLAGAPSQKAWAASPAVPSVDDEATAKQLFNDVRYVEAAVAFEQLWSAQGMPKFLFNAAMARELAGHELQAFVHLRRYLGLPGLAQENLDKARGRLQALRGRTVSLRVLVAPATLEPAALNLTLTRALDGAASDAGRTPVTLDGVAMAAVAVPGYGGAFDLVIEPGSWTLELAAEGFLPRSEPVIVASRGAAQQVVLSMKSNRTPTESASVAFTATFEPARAVAAGIDVTLDGPMPRQERVSKPSVTYKHSYTVIR